MTDQSFLGKVVIVTGSSSGIGAATARAFSRLGACVTLTSFDAENLEVVRKQCEEESIGQKKPLVVVGDIIKDEIVEQIMKETLKTFGRLDVLINNAGCGRLGNTETSSMEDFDFQVNLLMRAPFYMTKLAIPHLLKTKGCIINTSSVLAERPNDELTIYSMCKAGLSSFTKCLAQHLSPKGVRAVAVCPGYIETGIIKTLGIQGDELEHFHQKCIDTLLLKRAGKPEEVADLMVYIASEKASFMTGSCVTFDGGHTAKQPCLE